MRDNAYTRAAGPASVTEPIAGTIKNHDGGAVYAIDDMARARRFLIIGTAGGTFYQSERDITRENVEVLRKLAAEQPIEFVDMIRDISVRGIAPKLDPQLFALAICTATPGPARAEAFRLFPVIIRTGGHLLTWAKYHKALGGKVARSWRTAVARWYTERNVGSLAYQLAKYGQREGWAQKDLIDMSHALAGELPAETRAALRWARGEVVDKAEFLPPLLRDLVRDPNNVPALIADGASWEMLPDTAKRDPRMWAQLLAADKLPLGAMLRQLPRLTELKVIDDYFVGESAQHIRAKFEDINQLRLARLHPLNGIIAMRAYAGGSTRSGLSYRPNQRLLEVLDKAFYDSFLTAPSAEKRTLVGVDVSPSMNSGTSLGLTAAEIAMVISMKITRSEPASIAVGFAQEIRELGLTGSDSLGAAMAKGRQLSRMWGATNPGALIEFAERQKLPVDTFVVITDNEVNRGLHVKHLLDRYRRTTGIPAKLCVIATSVTNMSIADPSDPGMLDIAGFGSDVPALLTEFSRGF